MKTNVENMMSNKGNSIPNQFIIHNVQITYKSKTGELITPPKGNLFQSYQSAIVFKGNDGSVFLDEKYWDYSKTTGKYRNIFLNEDKKTTERKIKGGIYKLINLND